MMTVAELIALLQTMPQESIVMYRCCSDDTLLEAEEIKVFHKEDKKYVLRDGRVHEYIPKQWPKEWTPMFVDKILFPGN